MDDSRPPPLPPRRRPPGRALSRLAALVVAVAVAGEAAAQAKPPAAEAAAQAARRAAEAEQERARRSDELRRVEQAVAVGAETRARLEREAAEIRNDRARLAASLIEATERAADLERRIAPVEERVATLSASEDAIRRSLAGRSDVIADILAALQRMGRHPPPAILVRPDDVLAAIRSAMLFGSVLPELRAEADSLAADLTELERLRRALALEREALVRELAGLAEERERVAALVAARQAQAAEAERGLAAERARAAELGLQARTLKDLTDRLGREASASRRAADEAQRTAELQAREARERFAAAAFSDPARLAPKIAFAEARGLLPRPVAGPVLRGFGAPDEAGGTTRGVVFQARRRAVVSSPADGWVAYAGPFRSFGRLLIINAGGGYYLLLAGMEQINVEVGQFVLAGEPVATMGETPPQSPIAEALETADPALYVEFRKDGSSVDPGPWWSKSQGEKVRG